MSGENENQQPQPNVGEPEHHLTQAELDEENGRFSNTRSISIRGLSAHLRCLQRRPVRHSP